MTDVLAPTDQEALKEAAGVRPRTKLRRALRSMPKLSAVFLLLMILTAVFANVLAPVDPTQVSLEHSLAPPFFMEGGSTERILGADGLGRDVLSRVIHAARISLTVGLAATSLTAVIGTALGIIAGFRGGRIDTVISGLTDVWLAVPGLLFLLLLAIVIGRSVAGIIVAIGVLSWPSYCRIIRGQVLSLRSRDFVALARVAGRRPSSIMFVHIAPNIMSSVLVLGTLAVGGVIVLETSLSFLGLGVLPPTPTWGGMINEGRPLLASAWWITTFPALGMIGTVIAANTLGDWLRDWMDPKSDTAGVR